MKFKQISIEGWRQFANVDIAFHPRLTILTGANGAGKSTVLKILAQHFGWRQALLGTPKISKNGTVSYVYGLFKRLLEKQATYSTTIGSISYSNLSKAEIQIPQTNELAYSISIQHQQPVEGIHIDSHRSAREYQRIAQIPTQGIGIEQASAAYNQEMMSMATGHGGHTPTYRLKEALISMAAFGPGNQYITRNAELEQGLVDFKRVLATLLPTSLGFKDISIRIPDVVIVTETGEFLIDAASGGLMALIDFAWQIFLFSNNRKEFVVTIDEPENHLHPSMQRSLMRKLLAAFPGAQFIVATHSPFIVSAVKDSAVYVLHSTELNDTEEPFLRRGIQSAELKNINKAGTASEILQDVLGVSVTLPEWAEEELQSIAREYLDKEVNADLLSRLRSQLNAAGLAEFYPDALKIITKAQ
jgi:hypothetical protein